MKKSVTPKDHHQRQLVTAINHHIQTEEDFKTLGQMKVLKLTKKKKMNLQWHCLQAIMIIVHE